MLKLSVIIPTFNRGDLLKKCLLALFKQSFNPKDFEILVIDDGSKDNTENVIQGLNKRITISLRYFKHPTNLGSATARNLGIKKATAELLLFLGDDIIADKNLISEHLKSHKKYPNKTHSVLGLITWHPCLKINSFMRYLENKGPQFHYWQIEDKTFVDYKYFYSSNISVKKCFLKNYDLFDEDFKYPAFEDIELGYRLNKRNLKIVFNKNAIGYHYHPVTLRSYQKRMVNSGKMAKLLITKHSELLELIKKPSFGFKKRLIIATLSLIYPLAEILGLQFLISWYFRLKTNQAFCKGFFGQE